MSHKTALITGANGNLGGAVVKNFMDRGWTVVGLVHHHSKSILTHPRYSERVVDLLREDDCQKVVADLIQEYKNIDAAVFTAGGFKMGTIEQTGSKDLISMLHLNFITAYHIARPILLEMEKGNRGRLFFIGSGQGMNPAKGKTVVAYSLSKSLLFHLSEIINAEHPDGALKSFVVVPGTIDTPQNREDMPNADFNKWEKPEDIAELIHQYTVQEETQKSILVVKEELDKSGGLSANLL